MTKKQDKPSKIYRFVIYPIVGVVFVTILLFVIVLANGYKFSYTNGLIKLQKTGMIIVATKPQDSEILLDGVLKGHNAALSILSMKVSGVLPGKHNLAIVKKDYQKWEKSIVVKPDLVTWLEYVLLFPAKIKSEPVKQLTDSQFISADKDNKALLFKKSTKDGMSYFIYDPANGTKRNLWPPANMTLLDLPSNPEILSVEISSNRNKVLVKYIESGKIDWFIEELVNNEPSSFVKISKYGFSYDELLWNPGNQNELIGLYQQSLTRLTINGQGQLEQVPLVSKVIDYDVANDGNIYYIQEEKSNYVLDKMNLNGTNKVTIDKAVQRSSKYKFALSKQRDILALLANDSGNLVAYQKTNGLTNSVNLGSNIKDMSWSKKGNKLVYYNEAKAHIYDWEKISDEEVPLLNKIDKLDWYYDEYHLWGRFEGNLAVIEFDGQNKVNVVSSAMNESLFNISSFIYSTKTTGKDIFYQSIISF